MKKFIPLLLLAGFSSPAMATITNKLSSSVQLSVVAAAATQVERIGTTYSVSGSGVDTTYTPTGGSAVTDGIGSLTISSGVGAIPSIEATQKTARCFSVPETGQSFTQGDAISSNAPTTGAVANYSDITSTASGSAGDLAGTILTSGRHDTNSGWKWYCGLLDNLSTSLPID